MFTLVTKILTILAVTLRIDRKTDQIIATQAKHSAEIASMQGKLDQILEQIIPAQAETLEIVAGPVEEQPQ